MKREDLIRELKNIEFCAIPTVMTMDMGLEYDYITPEGAGSCLGRIGEWPAYKMRGIGKTQWETIRSKLKEGKLVEKDFAGTDIGTIIESLHRVYGDMYDEFYNDMAITFEDLQSLPVILPEYFYCMLDIRAWGERPRFYVDRETFLKAFQDDYCYDICTWDEMDDEDLDMWLARTKDDLAEFPIIEFEDVID